MLRILLRIFKRLYTYKSSIHFIYANEYRYFGSTVLRGQQLSLIAQKALSHTNRVYFTSADYNYKNCTLFLTKWAIFTLSLNDLKRLKENGNILFFDPVDAILKPERLRYADIVVAASETIYKSYKRTFPSSTKVFVVDHNVDLRLKGLDWSKRPKKLRAGYFGEAINAVLTPKIEKMVDIVPVNNITQDDHWFTELPKYNLHYAIRQTRGVYPNKPFLKGFTAAHCDANILIQDSEKEAVRWLGKDYPYLMHGKVTEKNILEMLKYAKKSFGSKVWERGLKTMRRIIEKTSEEAIGKQLVKLFAEVKVTT